jgi:hypothetical protein
MGVVMRGLPSWFHGRISSRIGSIRASVTTLLIAPASANRVGITFLPLMQQAITTLTLPTLNLTETGTIDPVTGVVAITGTIIPAATGSFQDADFGFLVAPTSALVGVNLQCLTIGRNQGVELWWTSHGDLVRGTWFGRGFPDVNRSVSFIETFIIDGTIDDYVRYCRSRE